MLLPSQSKRNLSEHMLLIHLISASTRIKITVLKILELAVVDGIVSNVSKLCGMLVEA